MFFFKLLSFDYVCLINYYIFIIIDDILTRKFIYLELAVVDRIIYKIVLILIYHIFGQNMFFNYNNFKKYTKDYNKC